MNEFSWKASLVVFRKLGEQSVQLGGVVAEYLDSHKITLGRPPAPFSCP
jgi:hypothetical protein